MLGDEPNAALDPKTSRQIMELRSALAAELHLPVLINIHNVTEAKEYTQRIVGMRFGRIIFDSVPTDLTQDAMDEIYAGVPAEERGETGDAESLREVVSQ